MKKIIFSALLFLPTLAKADIFDLSKSNEVTIHYTTSTILTGGTTAIMLIDLSDIINFPHKKNSELHLTSVSIEMDKAAASTATARIGVVNYVGISTGSVTWIMDNNSGFNASNTNRGGQILYPDEGINLKVNPNSVANTDGLTPYLASNEKTSGVTAYQSTGTFTTSLGNAAPPAKGDLMFEYFKGTGAYTFTIDIRYYAR